MASMRFKLGIGISLSFILMASDCSSPQIKEELEPPMIIPEYVKVPHPAGFDLADLRAIFVNPLAPPEVTGAFSENCDESFKKLVLATQLKAERDLGANELVTKNPEQMHWCFYSKISKLQEVLQSDSTWTERQKRVLETFDFLAPIANAFLSTYHDSRYLRWAAQYYSRISEWVFFKKLAPSPESTVLFVNNGRPELESWVNVQREESKSKSVFSKYGISFEPTVAGATNPFGDVPDRAPAANKK